MNGAYVRELLFKMFTSSFPNLPAQAVTLIIQRMFENCKDQSAFKIHLRDFLVQIKEFGDGADLYLDERQAELDSRAAELQKRQAAVGGLINPHARQDDGMAD